MALTLRSLPALDKLPCLVRGCDGQDWDTARSPEILCDLRFDLEKHGSVSTSTRLKCCSQRSVKLPTAPKPAPLPSPWWVCQQGI